MKKLLIILLILIASKAQTQLSLSVLNQDITKDRSLTFSEHTAVKPQIQISDSAKNISLFAPVVDAGFSYNLPSIGFRYGVGLLTQKSFGEKLYFRSSIVYGRFENNLLTRSNSILENHNTDPHEYLDLRGRIIYAPNRIFSFQAGYDQNFIGEGSRSLLLSDYGFPYPFAMIRSNFWRIDYTVMYQFLNEKFEGQRTNKYAASHYLSFNATKWLNIGVFETVLFQPKDSVLNRGFELEYLNPVIFYRPQEYSLGSADNVLLGMNISAKISRQMLYGQLLLDEFLLSEIKAGNGWWANKFAIQFGLKGKISKRFEYRLETNVVRPYTYAHSSVGQNYGHQNATLAHPYGANFAEVLSEVTFKLNKLSISTFANVVLSGKDTLGGNLGSDIYKSYNTRPMEYGHRIGQGTESNFFNAFIRFSYLHVPRIKLSSFIEFHTRLLIADAKSANFGLFLGFRTSLWNDYHNY